MQSHVHFHYPLSPCLSKNSVFVWNFKAVAVKIYMLPWQVSILRSQLNSRNAEVEMERLMRAQELESQAQEQRDKLKELQKELEHTKTQLEFKVSIMSC